MKIEKKEPASFYDWELQFKPRKRKKDLDSIDDKIKEDDDKNE